MTTRLPTISLHETSSRRIYRAKRNGKEIGEFRGYGETEQDWRESAMKQAILTLTNASMVEDFLSGKCEHPI